MKKILFLHGFFATGSYTPTEQEVKTWYAPLAQKMMMEFSAKEERYFQHFKGGKYKFIHSAFDSETQERGVKTIVFWAEFLSSKTYVLTPLLP